MSFKNDRLIWTTTFLIKTFIFKLIESEGIVHYFFLMVYNNQRLFEAAKVPENSEKPVNGCSQGQYVDRVRGDHLEDY